MTKTARNLLLVNADDFGWSASVNRGVVDAHVDGIVTSASILAAGSAFEDAVELARSVPTLSVGVHLNLYRGRPVLPADRVASLVDQQGAFPGDWRVTVRRLLGGQIDLAEVDAEFRAAVERVIDAGITPTHLDSEKHLHLWPSVFDVVCRVAADYDIPRIRVVREPVSARWVPLGLSAFGARNARVALSAGLRTSRMTIGVTREVTSPDLLASMLARANAETVELVCHPGRIDDDFRALQRTLPNKLIEVRELELAALTDPAARACVVDAGFQLCSVFGES